tara:strand:- start:325 stop:657 length:333 start_codon:yes stop_codon:yes gene_type:complete
MKALKFNLDAYDKEFIDKDDFLQAMEEHYLHLSMPLVRRQTLIVVERIKNEIIGDFNGRLPKDWQTLSKKVDHTKYYADYLTDLSFDLQHYIEDRLDEWLIFCHYKRNQQ